LIGIAKHVRVQIMFISYFSEMVTIQSIEMYIQVRTNTQGKL